MANKLTEAQDRNRRAAEDLDRALKECLTALRARPEVVVEARLRLIAGGRE